MAFNVININNEDQVGGTQGPLADLYSDNGFTYDVYQFPTTITQNSSGQNQENGHYTIFYFNLPQQSSWAQGGNSPYTTSNVVQPVANRSASSQTMGLINPQTNQAAPVVTEPINTALTLMTQPYKRTNCVVSIFTPNILLFNQDMEWDQISFTDALGVAGKVFAGLGAAMNGNIGQGLAAAGSALGNIKIQGISAVPGSNLGQIGQIINQQKYGQALNPNNVLVFKQINFRRFHMEWVMVPENQTEAYAIQEIIYQFRFMAAPEISTQATGGLTSGIFFTVPGSVDIDFISNGARNTYLPRISTCYITNVTVDYAAAGQWVAHYDGTPVAVRLGIDLVESEILTKGKIQAGF